MDAGQPRRYAARGASGAVERALTQTARLFVILLVLAPVSVFAQSPGLGGHGGPPAGGAGVKEDVVAKPVPPPALPGAEPATEGVIPSDKSAADMPPTEALFDSIHRGDVVSARDALNRGADLDGHNVLGQSPLDLAIDLNRNDITFLLLSMGGGSASGREQRIASAPPPEDRTPRGRHAHQAAVRAVRIVAAESGPLRPQLFASDGGEPKPAIGFLGFGSR